MSLRKAINAKCRECICDPLDAGTAAQQIACCVASHCPLHSVRPITATVIPIELLERYHVPITRLDPKARALIREGGTTPGSGRIGPAPSKDAISGGEV